MRGFTRLMNERARVLGLGCTRFATPYGGKKGDRSCAADLAAMTRLAMAERRIVRIARIPYTQIPAAVKGKRLYLATTNPLLAAGSRGTIGLKTGYTVAAGRCLIAVVRRGKRTLAAVLLDSPNPGEQAKRLLEAAFRKA
jgi:D-alanyl-D-alanine carboxypeptidase (penicillin-binding protein 5/6)